MITKYRSFRKGILSGIKNNHPFFLLFGIVSALLTITAINSLSSNGYLGKFPVEYVLRENIDHEIKVTHSVFSMKSQTGNNDANLFILGGSSMREAIENESSMKETIFRETGQHINTYLLATKLRSFATCLAIVEHLPKNSGTVIIGINFSRFIWDLEKVWKQLDGKIVPLESTRLYSFMQSNYQDEFAKKNQLPEFWYSLYGQQTQLAGMYVYVQDFIHKRYRSGFFYPIEYKQHLYTSSERRSSREQKQKQLKIWLENRFPKKSIDTFNLNLGLLEQIIKTAQKKGLKVVLVEQPLDYEFIKDSLDDFFASYQPEVISLSRKYGIKYLNFIKELNFSSSEFGDLAHLSFPASRLKFEQRLAKELIPE